ncbi:hypothetical protein LXL04_006761 [Taraxacum kok-saghyz]
MLLNMRFSMYEPRPLNWNPKDSLLVDGYFHDTKVYRVYIDSRVETDVLYEHCFRQVPAAWIERLMPETGGPLVEFSGHGVWPLVTIDPSFSVISHNGKDRVKRLIEFTIIRYPEDHNILLALSHTVYKTWHHKIQHNVGINHYTVRIGTTLSVETKAKLIVLLKQYYTIFAWKPTDMVGVNRSIIEHSLNILPGSS